MSLGIIRLLIPILLILVPEIGYWISRNDSKFIASEIKESFRTM